MKDYEMILRYEKITRSTKISVERKAHLECDHFFKLSHVNRFMQDLKNIYKDIQKCAKCDTNVFIHVDLVVAEYSKDSDDKLIQDNFDMWNYEGIAEADGLHLNPVTRYTDATHDMWLDFKGNPFEDITA